MRPLDAALGYAEKFRWAVFPRPQGRFVGHGRNDATRDPEQITKWWTEWPDALIAVSTGAASDLVVADIDRKNGKDGFDTLETLGKSTLPETPMVYSPHNGLHLYFRCHWRTKIFTQTDALGPGVDVIGENGSIAVPTPGWKYRWDDTYHPEKIPMLMAPMWLATRRQKPADSTYFSGNLDPLIILDRACRMIRDATPGNRNEVINRQAFLIGALVNAGALSKTLAEHELCAAAGTMVALTAGNGKKAGYDLDRGFAHGQRKGRLK